MQRYIYMLTQQLYINLMKYMFVQSVLPQEDAIALKKKTGKSSMKEAIAKAVHYYLKDDVSNTNDN